jgi:GTP-binding protein
MKFVDEVEIEVRSGNGGKGAVRFKRQKYMPKMGPDGGDGGRGGSVFFEATRDLQSLLDFRFSSDYSADNGEDGQGNDCNGSDGEDLLIRVPVGTVVRDADTGTLLLDLVEENVQEKFLSGGRGGLGNMNFATPSRQAPDFAQPGEPGQTRKIRLELKLLADVALVGFPNAGKSSLISRLSSARPKIANYPFTTLVPNLGVVRGKKLDFVVADIPGLIEGASEGKGLGIRFLKHVERCRVVLYILDLGQDEKLSLVDEYKVLRNELKKFSQEILEKPYIVCVNKSDIFGGNQQKDILDLALSEKGIQKLQSQIEGPLLVMSAVSGEGLDVLVQKIENVISSLGPRLLQNESAMEPREWGDQTLFGETPEFEGNPAGVGSEDLPE